MIDALALERRREIHAYISKHPGSYFNEIKDGLDLPTGVLQHHLAVLEKIELIAAETEGPRKRYFIRHDIPYPDRRMLAIICLKRNRDILILILTHHGATFQQLMTHLGINKSTLSFHMKKLVESGLVVESMIERKKIYHAIDSDAVARILITYRSSFLDEAVDNFVQVWTEL